MLTDLTNPAAVKIFGSNLDTCLRLIGSKPESLALRCNTSPHIIAGFKQGLGTLSEQLLSAICKDVGVSRELILKEHRSPAEAVRQFKEAFRTKGQLTASNLIGTDKTRGEEAMTLSQGQLNDSDRKQNFGHNVQVCLGHLDMTAYSLAIRIEMTESEVNLIIAGKLSLTNPTIEAICHDFGLSVNDMMTFYAGEHYKLQEKLQAAGRTKPPKPVVEAKPEPARSLVPEEPAIPATVIPAETLETMEMKTMTDTNSVNWNDDDIIGTAGDRRFNLRDKEQRKLIGNNIRSLKEQRYEEDTWNEFFSRVDTKRDVVWLNGVRGGTSAITGVDVETFAEFFDVSVFALLAGEYLDLTEEAADDESSELAATEEPEADGVIANEVTAIAFSVGPDALEAPAQTAFREDLLSGDNTNEVDEPRFPTFGDDVRRSVAFQEHFKQRLLSADFHLADNVSPRCFLAATQAATVDWCNVYHTMTKGGVETLHQVSAFAERLDSGDATLNADIITHVLSMALKQR